MSLSASPAVELDATGLHYQELNARLAALAAAGSRRLVVRNVLGQRFIGTGLPGEVELELHGTPGEDLGAFLDGPTLRVFGNAQNAAGNTMSSGLIIIHGAAGDIVGHSMRGGQIWVQGSAGYRVGIHMKACPNGGPAVIVGGSAGDFLGEYMAGGVLIVLGLANGDNGRLVGNWLGTGMHGGAIYVRGEFPGYRIGRGAGQAPCDDGDRALLRAYLGPYCAEFGLDLEQVLASPFTKLAPLTARPYGRLYAGSVGEL
jgi:glutamate synthase domain-containing protein 3